jgi:hypothetical protein
MGRKTRKEKTKEKLGRPNIAHLDVRCFGPADQVGGHQLPISHVFLKGAPETKPGNTIVEGPVNSMSQKKCSSELRVAAENISLARDSSVPSGTKGNSRASN